jgi:chemotaxis protein CheX
LSGNAREEFGSEFQISVPTVVVGPEARLSQRNDSRNYAIPLNWHSETAYLLVALE